MSTPYNINYEGIVSYSGGSNGYPRDVIQEIIIYDIEEISANKDKFLAELILEQSEYHGRKLGESSCGDYAYEVSFLKDGTHEVTVIAYGIKIAKIKLEKLKEMRENEYNILFDNLTYSFRELDIKTKNMIESYGHEIYVDLKNENENKEG